MKRLFPVAILGALALCGVALVYADGPQTSDVAGGRVIGLRGFPIAAQNPADGQVLAYSANSKAYVPSTAAAGGSGISGLTIGQLGVAGSASTLTSSMPFGLTGNSTIVETTSGGLLTPSILPLATNAAIGGMRGDTTTINCVAGVCSAIGGAATSITVGTTTVGSGTTGNLLFNNAGVLGNETLASLLVSPPAIGGTTPAAGAFTTLSATGQITSTVTTGTAPFVVSSTTNVANLNASTLTGSAVGTSGATLGLLNANKTDSGANSFTGANNTFTAIAGVINTLTISTATFTPVLGSGVSQSATLVHASCPCTMANPSDTASHIGQSGVLVIAQSSTGSDTVGTWGSQYVFVGGTSAITLSTGANAVDYLPYWVADATHVVLSGVIKGPTH